MRDVRRLVLTVIAVAVAASSGAATRSEPERLAEQLERALRAAAARPVADDVIRAAARELAADLPLRAAADVLDGRDVDVTTTRRKLRVAMKGGELRVTPAALGDVRSDLLFVPLVPCRIFDTRIGSAPGRIGAGQSRSFLAAGSGSGFADQGGADGGCEIPIGALDPAAVATALNLIAVDPTGAGHFVVGEWGQPQPAASALNYSNSAAGLNIANQIIVPIAGTMLDDADLTVTAAVSAVHAVGDVTGYFTRFPLENVQTLTTATIAAASLDLGSGDCVAVSCEVGTPVPGTVTVSGFATFSINHTAGTTDTVTVTVSEAPNACVGSGTSIHDVSAAAGSDSTVDVTIPLVGFFEVDGTSPTQSFLAGVRMTSGANAGDVLTHVSMVCTFVPSPPGGA